MGVGSRESARRPEHELAPCATSARTKDEEIELPRRIGQCQAGLTAERNSLHLDAPGRVTRRLDHRVDRRQRSTIETLHVDDKSRVPTPDNNRRKRRVCHGDLLDSRKGEGPTKGSHRLVVPLVKMMIVNPDEHSSSGVPALTAINQHRSRSVVKHETRRGTKDHRHATRTPVSNRHDRSFARLGTQRKAGVTPEDTTGHSGIPRLLNHTVNMATRGRFQVSRINDGRDVVPDHDRKIPNVDYFDLIIGPRDSEDPLQQLRAVLRPVDADEPPANLT